MAKIHILGGSGSGKTTLARNLSSLLHLPHYDLDEIGLKNGFVTEEDAFAIAGNLDGSRKAAISSGRNHYSLKPMPSCCLRSPGP